MPEKSDRHCAWDCWSHTAHRWKGPLCLSLHASWDAGSPFWRHLFIISDSSGCQGSAFYRANTGLAHSCRKAPRKVSRGRENTGVDAALTIPDRLGGTFCGHSDSLCVACLLRSCSRPLSCSAAWGQADKAFFSPACACTQGDQAKACSREQGICEQPFLLPAAGVCWGRSYCGDIITRLWMTHRSLSTPGPNRFRSV